MKRQQIIPFLFIAFTIILTSCSIDPNYEAQKQFYLARKNAALIIQSKKGEIEDEDLEQIIDNYRQVIKASPLDPLAIRVQFIIYNIYEKKGKHQKALAELKKIIQNFSSNKKIASQATFLSGQLQEKLGNIDEAFLNYEKIVDFYPLSNIGLHMPIYLIDFSKKYKDKTKHNWAYEKSVRHYKNLMDEYRGTTVEAHLQNYIIELYLRNGAIHDAIYFFDKNIQAKTEAPEIMKASLAKINILTMQDGKIDEAHKICDELIQKYPDHIFTNEVKYRKVQLYLKENDLIHAEEMLIQLIDQTKGEDIVIDEENPDKESIMLKNLGIRCEFALLTVRQKQGYHQEVINGYHAIQKKYPEHFLSYRIPLLIYLYYLQANDSVNAEINLKKAISKYSRQIELNLSDQKTKYASQYLIICYGHQKNWTALANLLEDLVIRFPNTPRYLFMLSSVYKDKLKNYEKAQLLYQTILQKYQKVPEIMNYVKQALEEINEELRPDKSDIY